MPYEIKKEQGDPDGEFCVYEKDGKKIKCHPTQKEADDHMAALYANVEEAKGKSLDTDMLVALGGEIKSLGNGKYGGTLIRFTPKGDYDLTGDRFDADTNYGFRAGETKTAHLFFHHAQPLKTKSGKQFQIEDEIGTAELTITDESIEIIAQARKEYDALLARSLKSLGWSSGTANHLVKREQEEKGFYIKRWLLGDDVSMTPTPAEKRNAVYAMKALPKFEIDDALPTGSAEGTVSPATQAQGSNSNSNVTNSGGNEMDEKEMKALADAQKTLTDANTAQVKAIEEKDKEIKSLTARLDVVEKALKAEPPAGGTVKVNPEQKYPYKSFVKNTKGAIMDATGYGEMLQDVVAASSGTHSVSARLANWTDMNTKALKAASGLNVATPSEGGFFVQTDHATELIRMMVEYDDIIARLRKLPLAAGADGVTINGVDETSRASTIWGGILAYWLAEADAPTASKPKFREIKLEVKGLGALYYATDKLLKLAPTLGAEVSLGFREAMAFKVQDAVINGTGAGKPLGIYNSGSIVSVAKETNQTAVTLLHENISKMKARMFPSSFKNAIWLANIDTQPQWDTLAFTIGAAGVLSPYIQYSTEGVLMVHGRPVIFTEHCQTLGTTGDIYLWDPSSYYFIDLGAVEEASSIHIAFTTFDTCFRFGYYCDGQPKLASALTPAHGSNTLTTHVKLDTRG